MGVTGAGLAGMTGIAGTIGATSRAVDAQAPSAVAQYTRRKRPRSRRDRGERQGLHDGHAGPACRGVCGDRAGASSAVGTTADIEGLAGKNTQTFDAKGMTIVPGFIDCHNHAGGEVLLYEVLVGNPFEVEFVSISSIVEKLRAKAQQTPPGTWVEGFFFDDTKVKDKRPLHIRDLDQVSKDHPVVVRHRGGHTSFYNSKAFEMAGITKDTPNPTGGTFDRDEKGELTGRVTDLASAAFSKVGTRPTFTAGAARTARA